jgi:hypothetical protein
MELGRTRNRNDPRLLGKRPRKRELSGCRLLLLHEFAEQINQLAREGTLTGYESARQLNREYKRFFGQPPMRDIKCVGSPAPRSSATENPADHSVRMVGLWEAIDCIRLCLAVATSRCRGGRTVNSDGCKVSGTYCGRLDSDLWDSLRPPEAAYE